MVKNKIIGIYKIVSPTGKIYVGQSVNINNRKNKYKNFKCKSQPKIYRSLMKYGWEAHIFEIIEECPESYLDELEFWWKIFYGSVENGLNCHYKDLNGGYKSKETKQKISKSNKGKHKPSEEHILRIIDTNKNNIYNLGRKHSKQTNLKRNKSLKEVRKTKKWKCGRKKGWIMDEKHKNIVSLPRSEETKQKMRKPKSEQGKKNMRVPKPNLQKSILQYDLADNFIKEFPSLNEAYNSMNKPLNSSGITCCLKNRQKSAFGYKWKYK
jgi:group I intron endonuclease